MLLKVVLFVSSYAPLLLLFGILGSFGEGWPSQVCLWAGAASVVLLPAVWLLLKRSSTVDQATFEDARSRDSDVMAYVVSYVVPFAAATSASDTAMRWALGLFACIIAVLYLRSAVFYVHPLLLMAGIHVYDASREGVPVTILTRQRHLRHAFGMRVVSIGHNVYLEKPR